VVPLVMADVVALLRPSSVVALISSLSHCQTAKHNQRQAAMRDGGVGPTVGDRAKSRPQKKSKVFGGSLKSRSPAASAAATEHPSSAY
jgi:hypothetical protein